MASVTATQMVNRILQRARWPIISSITTDPLANVILQSLNSAMVQVLETEMWDEDYRHDGVLHTKASITGTIDVTNGSESFGNASPVIPTGDYVVKIQITDGTESDVALRVKYSSGAGGAFDAPYLGATATGAAYKLFVNEYLLPDTVREVTSVQHQGNDVALGFVDRKSSFQRMVPAPQREIGAYPTHVSVGSNIVPTYASPGVAPEPGLGFLVHEVPDSVYRLDYSYITRHPAITTEDVSVLEGVSENALFLIEKLCFSDLLDTNVFNDPELAKRNFEAGEYFRRRFKESDGSQNLKPNTLCSLDNRSGGRRNAWTVDTDGIAGGGGTYGDATYGGSEYS